VRRLEPDEGLELTDGALALHQLLEDADAPGVAEGPEQHGLQLADGEVGVG
jgi:hypothetical protein